MSREYRRKRTYWTIGERVRFPINRESAGKMLRSLRKREGVSQEALGKYLEVDSTLISRWENDKRPIGPSRVDFIAEYLLLFKEEREELLGKILEKQNRS